MTWNAFSRDPFQVQDRQIWPVFVDSLAQRQIKNQNTDTVWKTSKARLKHPPCIKTFLYKNNHKVANSYFPTWWDQLQPGINLDMCGADCLQRKHKTGVRKTGGCEPGNWMEQWVAHGAGPSPASVQPTAAAQLSGSTLSSGTKQDTVEILKFYPGKSMVQMMP